MLHSMRLKLPSTVATRGITLKVESNFSRPSKTVVARARKVIKKQKGVAKHRLDIA
jgi:hypothetical protein